MKTDQTIPSGAVSPGSALFAYGILSETLVLKILEHLPYVQADQTDFLLWPFDYNIHKYMFTLWTGLRSNVKLLKEQFALDSCSCQCTSLGADIKHDHTSCCLFLFCCCCFFFRKWGLTFHGKSYFLGKLGKHFKMLSGEIFSENQVKYRHLISLVQILDRKQHPLAFQVPL